MTALIGLRCSDGVVVGADSSSTSVAGGQFRTIEQPAQKVFVIDDKYIVAGTGSAGHCQRFCNLLKVAYDAKEFREKSEFDVCRMMTQKAIQDFASTGSQTGQLGALMAFPVKSKFHLAEFDIATLQPEFKTGDRWFVSMGSGQAITDPFLALMRKAFAPDGPPNLQDGLFMAAWALEHVIELNTGGINGPSQIAVLQADRKGDFTAKLLDNSEIEEHIESTKAAIKHLRTFRQAVQAQNTPDVPRPPTTK